jgi:hypothetical protein
MIANTLTELKKILTECVAAQGESTALWHDQEPPTHGVRPDGLPGPELLPKLILREHLINFLLWHVEDQARRKDVGPEDIVRCKQEIDGLNQSRNDAIEQVDACLVAMVEPLLPQDAATPRYNTESLGGALDRLSILSLKVYHMEEQILRTDVPEEHINTCRTKAGTLREQRQDLLQSALELIDDYALGLKRPKVYYQFKMYNDPNLNPELYGKKE